MYSQSTSRQTGKTSRLPANRSRRRCAASLSWAKSHIRDASQSARFSQRLRLARSVETRRAAVNGRWRCVKMSVDSAHCWSQRGGLAWAGSNRGVRPVRRLGAAAPDWLIQDLDALIVLLDALPNRHTAAAIYYFKSSRPILGESPSIVKFTDKEEIASSVSADCSAAAPSLRASSRAEQSPRRSQAKPSHVTKPRQSQPRPVRRTGLEDGNTKKEILHDNR